jgi:hypothetical protein
MDGVEDEGQYLEPDDEDVVPPRHLVPVGHNSSPHASLHPSSLPLSDPIPWDRIRRFYVQGIACGPSYPDRTDVLAAIGRPNILAEKHGPGRREYVRVGQVKIVFPNLPATAAFFGVPERLVLERSRDEDWWGLQRIYRAQLHQKQAIIKGQQRIIDVEAIDRRAFAVAKLGLRMVHERLEMMTQTVEVMDGDVNPVTDYKELESLARAASVWHQVGRRALGFPVDKVGIVGELGVGVAGQGELGTDFGLFDAAPAQTPAQTVDQQPWSEANFAAAMGPGGAGDMDDDAKPSVSEELAKDDSERLLGFLTVLGRAQDASQQEEEAGETAEIA